MKKNQNLSIVLIIILLILAIGFFLMLIRGDEDTWLCQNGQWIKHGNPSAPQPLESCGAAVNDNQNQANNNTNNTNINIGNQTEPNITVSCRD
ncbi:hypothetical protein HZA71_02110 [Candidatus Falkowbacteria bacterium]|nr:hypothetical protein [Candidatus Falkowbacteria bacterium]